LPSQRRLNGGVFLNFSPKKNIFHAQKYAASPEIKEFFLGN